VADRYRLLGALALLATALASLLTAGPARADETHAPVAHLAAYNLDWLAYLDPQDVPATRYAVCIVDTGVAVTPDTPPDNPNGPILRRLAVDGGSGEPQGTTNNLLHGTRMAFAAVAPQNDWGTIGTWPGGSVVSIRASADTESTPRTEAYERSLVSCLKQRADFPIAAALVSLSCRVCHPTEQEKAGMQNVILRLHQRHVSIVAAAGNTAGAPGYPAAEAGVVSVAAGDLNGGLCADSAYSDEVILGPACPIQTADPLTGTPQAFKDGGTSSAAAATATLLAAIRSLRPDSSHEQVEGWVRGSVRLSDGLMGLDGEAAARAAGLGGVVDRARARMPEPDATAAPAVGIAPADPEPRPADEPIPGVADARRARLLPPLGARVRWRRGFLRVAMRGAECGARLKVEAVYRAGRLWSRSLRSSNRLVMRLPSLPRRIYLSCLPKNAQYRPSRRLRYRRVGRGGYSRQR